MAESEWIAHAGVITGIIGAITGVVGAVTGLISYRRTETLKFLDLRLELKRLDFDLRSVVNELPNQIQHAKQSRLAVFSATGRLRSGLTEKWNIEWASDLLVAEEMINRLPNLDADYSSLHTKILEKKLIHTHRAMAEARILKDKYDQEISKDDKERGSLRASHTGRA